MIQIETGPLGTIHKWLVKELEDLEIRGKVESSARILRRVLEVWGDMLSSKSSERPSANVNAKNTEGVKIDINDN